MCRYSLARAGLIVCVLLTSLVFAPGTLAQSETRPNILCITCEDTGPHLGCYGDELAVTPNLDRLATESVRYTRAFAYTGVCAPSRSCLITGVYPTRLGSMHMRSRTTLPDFIRCFPAYLRDAGYYCTNNVKEDYNFAKPKGTWDDSSRRAHWRGRGEGQAFFSVFNFTVCHQSHVFGSEEKHRKDTARLTPEQLHDPAEMVLPPIHPDTPEFRQEWAWHYDNVTAMDYQVGDVLRELEEDGLADETIVFFFSDHGTGIPSIKMFAWHPSLHVPLLVRFPEKWGDLAPAASGETCDQLVSFVDFAPTVLSLCGVDIPNYMQGQAFLGEQATEPRKYVYGAKDRQAECSDTIRYVHDGKLHYLRNFQPHLPWGQYMSYVENHASVHAWRRLRDAGELSGPMARYWQTKPMEELYDVEADPWETRNLSDDPAYAADLQRLRTECYDWMQRTGDLGLLSEHEFHSRAREAGTTPYEIAVDPQLNPLPDLLAAAEVANHRDPSSLPEFVELLHADDPAVRYWGATGLLTLGVEAAPARTALLEALFDTAPDVRVVAAEALAQLGETEPALAELSESLAHESPPIRLAALQVLQRIGPPAAKLTANIKQAGMKDPHFKDVCDYIGRMVGYLPKQLEDGRQW